MSREYHNVSWVVFSLGTKPRHAYWYTDVVVETGNPIIAAIIFPWMNLPALGGLIYTSPSYNFSLAQSNGIKRCIVICFIHPHLLMHNVFISGSHTAMVKSPVAPSVRLVWVATSWNAKHNVEIHCTSATAVLPIHPHSPSGRNHDTRVP